MEDGIVVPYLMPRKRFRYRIDTSHEQSVATKYTGESENGSFEYPMLVHRFKHVGGTGRSIDAGWAEIGGYDGPVYVDGDEEDISA